MRLAEKVGALPGYHSCTPVLLQPETRCEHYISLDGLRGKLHFLVEFRISYDACSIANLEGVERGG